MVPDLPVRDNLKEPMGQNRETVTDVIEEINPRVGGDPAEAGNQAVGADRGKIVNRRKNYLTLINDSLPLSKVKKGWPYMAARFILTLKTWSFGPG